MNSAVWPIFNEKIVEKWSLWVPWIGMGALFTGEKSTTVVGKKKKERENVQGWNADAISRIQTNT